MEYTDNCCVILCDRTKVYEFHRDAFNLWDEEIKDFFSYLYCYCNNNIFNAMIKFLKESTDELNENHVILIKDMIKHEGHLSPKTAYGLIESCNKYHGLTDKYGTEISYNFEDLMEYYYDSITDFVDEDYYVKYEDTWKREC